jgi:hypothetical protein
VTLEVLALWFVCSLGTAILAAVAPLSRSALAVLGAAFVTGAWWAQQPFAPSTPLVAIAAALMAVWQVARSPERPYAAVMAGILAGLWTAALNQQGLPLVVAIPAAAMLPIGSAYLRARREVFAPPALRDEALLVLAVVGTAAAALPGVAEGWHAAVNLSVQGGQPPAPSADTAMPGWTLAVASVALVSGGLFSLWSRR